MHLSRLVLRDTVARRRGHIVNVASAAGAFGLPYQVVPCGYQGGAHRLYAVRLIGVSGCLGECVGSPADACGRHRRC
jgi:hypothetical protein